MDFFILEQRSREEFDMVNDILHHACTGAIIALLFSTPKKTWFYLLLGAAAALLPDVTKELFQDSLLHSLIAAPFAAALFAGILKTIFKKEPFMRIFGSFLAAFVFGHLLLDLIDNGNAIFYPFVKEELEYSIISKSTPLVWIIALAAISAGLAFKRIRLLSAAGILTILLYIGFQAAAKEMVTNALHDRYPFPNAAITVFPTGEWPWEAMNWSYHARSEQFLASGDSNATGGKISETLFYFTAPGEGLRYRVEEWTKTRESFVLKCFDEQNGQIVYFESSDGIHWRPAA